jgi:hypothetical protein
VCRSPRAQALHAAQQLDLVPQPRLRARVEYVQLELAQLRQRRSRLQLADDSQRVDLPHRHRTPQPGEAQHKLPIVLRHLVIREPEVLLQPLQKLRLEDVPKTIERIARQPDQLRPAEAQAAHMLHLLDQRGRAHALGQPHAHGTIRHLAGDVHRRKVLPDELQHQQLVEVCVEQRPHDGVQLPVMIVRALGEVDVHRALIVRPAGLARQPPASATALQSMQPRQTCRPGRTSIAVVDIPSRTSIATKPDTTRSEV